MWNTILYHYPDICVMIELLSSLVEYLGCVWTSAFVNNAVMNIFVYISCYLFEYFPRQVLLPAELLGVGIYTILKFLLHILLIQISSYSGHLGSFVFYLHMFFFFF